MPPRPVSPIGQPPTTPGDGEWQRRPEPPADRRARGAETGTERPKVRLKSMQMQIREQLVHDIISGVLAPGSRITQAELAGQFGVSLAPVREALRELNNEGLVELDPFTGVTVHRPTLESLENVYEVRLALEPIAIPRGPVKITEEVALRATHLISVMDRNVDKSSWTAANREFHRLLRNLCPNGLALQLLQRLENLFDMYVSLSIINRSDANDEHRQLLDAYRRGSRHEILKMTREHITRTFEAVASGMSELPLTEDGSKRDDGQNGKRSSRGTVQ